MTRAAREALEMLTAFASVGAECFDLTFTDTAGHKVAFRGDSIDVLETWVAGRASAFDARC